MIVIPLSPSVKIARVPSPSSRVMDAPAATVQPLAATTIASGGLLLLSVSTPLAAVPGGIPPAWAQAGITRITRTTHASAKAAPNIETARPILTLLRHTNNEKYCAAKHACCASLSARRFAPRRHARASALACRQDPASPFQGSLSASRLGPSRQ